LARPNDERATTTRHRGGHESHQLGVSEIWKAIFKGLLVQLDWIHEMKLRPGWPWMHALQ
jgi:hypothetical protein